MSKIKSYLSGNGGMGSTKHGKSGFCTKSPKFRFNMKLEAEKNENKPKPTNCVFGSVSELFKKK
jgi:hypothetical protein